MRETDRPTDRPTCRETEAAAAAAEEETTRSIIPPPLPLPPTPTRAPTGGPSPDRNLRSKPSNVRHAPGPAVHSARGRPVIAARATVRAETLDRPVNLEQKQHGTSAARLRRRRRQLSARTECTRDPPLPTHTLLHAPQCWMQTAGTHLPAARHLMLQVAERSRCMSERPGIARAVLRDLVAATTAAHHPVQVRGVPAPPT